MAVAARRRDLRRTAGNPKSGKNVVHNGFSCRRIWARQEEPFWQGVIRNGVRDENGFFFHECRLRRAFRNGAAGAVAGAATGPAI
ncbi:hypothetical protein D3C78_1292870 [compost metagenome]